MEFVGEVAEEVSYVTRGLKIETCIGRCNSFLSHLQYFLELLCLIFSLPALNTSLFIIQNALKSLSMVVKFFYCATRISDIILFLSHLVSSWSQQSRKMTEISTKLGIYTMCNWNWEKSCLTWNIRSKECVLQHRPNSVLVCCASSCLGCWVGSASLLQGEKIAWG